MSTGDAAWYAKHKDTYAAYRAKNRERRLDLARQRTYGLSREDYDAMIATQHGCCAACGMPFTGMPQVDHDHATGVVRGLLCPGCNRAAGQCGDDPVRLRALAPYLERFI